VAAISHSECAEMPTRVSLSELAASGVRLPTDMFEHLKLVG